jgi:molybdenum cofactor cytidylyltransferase
MRGGAVLLAAGFSRRFGSDKRRHRLADGISLLAASARLYGAAFDRLVVVLRPEDEDAASEVEHTLATARIVRCADAHLGMGHSLAEGARHAQGWDYLFVALADMPWVNSATLQRLRAVLEAAPPDRIVQPAYRGEPGHPVGFGAGHLIELTRLQGDAGARSLLRDAAGWRQVVEVDDPGVLADLDTPADR